MFKHRLHSVPELNTTSTADISFMLLIFFLVTTSMNVDKGLTRQLPPVENNQTQEETNVEKDKLLTLELLSNGTLMINDEPTDLDKLESIATDFISSRGKDHLISIETQADAKYETYFNIQNALMSAYRNVRNLRAQQLFGRKYDACPQAQRDSIRASVPQRIAEQYDTKGGSEQ